jgi:hypothetical protein
MEQGETDANQASGGMRLSSVGGKAHVATRRAGLEEAPFSCAGDSLGACGHPQFAEQMGDMALDR